MIFKLLIEYESILFKFLIEEEPLPEFNAYSLWDVITNFWILGVIILICIPYQIVMALYGYAMLHRGPENLFLNFECVAIHVVIH